MKKLALCLSLLALTTVPCFAEGIDQEVEINMEKDFLTTTMIDLSEVKTEGQKIVINQKGCFLNITLIKKGRHKVADPAETK